MAEYVDAKLFLKGRAARSLEVIAQRTVLYNHQSEVLEVSNSVLSLLDRTKGETDAKFARAFGLMEQEPSIRAVSVSLVDRGLLFQVPRARYPEIARAEPVMESVLHRKTVTTRETLRIVTLSFDPALRWKLERIRIDERITAAISDQKFLQHLKAREDQFADGDTLEVTLKFEQERPTQEKDWVDVAGTHAVTTVHKHNPLPRTKQLKFPQAP